MGGQRKVGRAGLGARGIGVIVVALCTMWSSEGGSLAAAPPAPKGGAATPTPGSHRLPVRRDAVPAVPAPPGGARLAPAGTGPLVNDPSADATALDTQSETTIVRVGTQSVLVSAFNDSGSYGVTSNHFTGYATSVDGGSTWVDRGALPASDAGDAGDPVLAYSAKTNTVMLTTLRFNDGAGVQVFRSTSSGTTFNAPVNAYTGLSPNTGLDKQWIAVDNFTGTGYGNSYVLARDFGPCSCMLFSHSTDDGLTWGPSGGLAIASGGQGAFVVVGPDHSVYAFWLDDTNVMQVRRSTDQGVSFGPASTVATLVDGGINGDLGLAGGFRTNGFPHAVIHPTTGQLFVVYNDLDAPGGQADVWMTVSTDGGATWSTRRRVNTTAAGDQWLPTLMLSPDAANLMVSWYDRRNDPANSWLQRYAALGQVSGTSVTFGRDFALSPLFPVVVGQDPAINPTYMGDYDQIAAGSVDFVGTWGDNRGASAIHAYQPDVRAARVRVRPSASDLAVSASGGPIDLGGAGTLTITASNPGTVPVPGASVAVGLPVGLVAEGVSSPKGECTAPGGSRAVTCFLGDLAAGERVSISAVARAVRPGSQTVAVTSAHPGTDSQPSNDATIFAVAVIGTASVKTYSTATQCPIADLATVDCPLAVRDPGTLLEAVASVRIQHTFDADLQISLVAPDGTAVLLADRVGGAGHDFGTGPDPCDSSTAYTAFDDGASASITTGSPPFAAAFRPVAPLAALADHQQVGIWQLRVADLAGGDIGSVLCWGLRSSYLPEPAPTVSVVGCAAKEASSCVFTVKLSQPTAWDVTVGYSTVPGTAIAADYTRTSGTVTIPTGTTTRHVGVPLADDDRTEPDEVFALALSSPIGANQGSNAAGTIHDGTLVYRARFSDAEAANINHAAAYFGQHADALRFATRLVRFVDTLLQPQGLAPVSPPPTSSGPVSFIARYTQAEDAQLHAIASRLGLGMDAYHVFAARLLELIWYFSTH